MLEESARSADQDVEKADLLFLCLDVLTPYNETDTHVHLLGEAVEHFKDLDGQFSDRNYH